MRVLLLVVLLAGTAHAGDNEVSFGSTARALRSSSADAITGDSLVGGGVGIGRALGVELPRRLTLWSDAGISWSGATGTMFSVLGTDLFDTTITAGLHLRYQPIRNIGISAGVAIGAQHASLSITDTMAHTASDTAWGALALSSRRPTRRDVIVAVPFVLLALWAERNIGLAVLFSFATVRCIRGRARA